jgi:hypothetical protein
MMVGPGQPRPCPLIDRQMISLNVLELRHTRKAMATKTEALNSRLWKSFDGWFSGPAVCRGVSGGRRCAWPPSSCAPRSTRSVSGVCVNVGCVMPTASDYKCYAVPVCSEATKVPENDGTASLKLQIPATLSAPRQ